MAGTGGSQLAAPGPRQGRDRADGRREFEGASQISPNTAPPALPDSSSSRLRWPCAPCAVSRSAGPRSCSPSTSASTRAAPTPVPSLGRSPSPGWNTLERLPGQRGAPAVSPPTRPPPGTPHLNEFSTRLFDTPHAPPLDALNEPERCTQTFNFRATLMRIPPSPDRRFPCAPNPCARRLRREGHRPGLDPRCDPESKRALREMGCGSNIAVSHHASGLTALRCTDPGSYPK